MEHALWHSPHSDEVLWETGSAAHEKTSFQPAWTLTCMHSEPADRHLRCPLLGLHTSWKKQKKTTPGPAFNKISPMKLIGKLHTLGLSTTLGNWILDFLTNRPKTVGIGSHTSFTLMLNAGAPQGAVLRPLQFTMYTHDWNPRHGGNCVVNFVDKKKKINSLAKWCIKKTQHCPMLANPRGIACPLLSGKLCFVCVYSDN